MGQRKGGLGRQGLDALFQSTAEEGEITAVNLKLAEVEPNRAQPRTEFDAEALEELADSIREVGIIQPIIVRTQVGGGYQIVAGERRWRAAQIAGLSEIPAVVRELSDRDVAELALIENLQREDLNAVEEAEGYKHLMSEYSMTQEQVAERVGKSRPAVANSVRLLELPEPVIDMLKKGSLTAGHARALLSLPTDADIVRVGAMAAKKGMTVRDVEKAVRNEKKPPVAKQPKPSSGRSSYLDEVELALSEALRRRVKVTGTDKKGTLEVDFFSIEELADMAQRLGRDM